MYKNQLKIDFPRIPYPKDANYFFSLVALGRELRELHLMHNRLDEGNIAYVPGTFFCPDGGGKNTMRLNFSTTSEEKIQECMPILGQMICKYLDGNL